MLGIFEGFQSKLRFKQSANKVVLNRLERVRHKYQQIYKINFIQNSKLQIWPKSCAIVYILVPYDLSTFWFQLKILRILAYGSMETPTISLTCVTTLGQIDAIITTLNLQNLSRFEVLNFE